MKTTRMKSQQCPICKAKLDAATSPFEDTTPSEGDLTVCAYCGTRLQFGHDLTLHVTTERDPEGKIEEVERAVTQIIRERKRDG